MASSNDRPDATESRTLIFVYGTLKTGGVNHAQMAGQRFAGPAKLVPGFTLYSLGEYPGLVVDPLARDGVTGEIWAVDSTALDRLDAFEGVDKGLYARVPAPLATWAEALSSTESKRVWMYLYRRGIEGRVRIGDTWPI